MIDLMSPPEPEMMLPGEWAPLDPPADVVAALGHAGLALASETDTVLARRYAETDTYLAWLWRPRSAGSDSSPGQPLDHAHGYDLVRLPDAPEGELRVAAYRLTEPSHVWSLTAAFVVREPVAEEELQRYESVVRWTTWDESDGGEVR